MLIPLPVEIKHDCIIGIEEPTLYGLSLESSNKRKDFKESSLLKMVME
jgi:hypothetical protein